MTKQQELMDNGLDIKEYFSNQKDFMMNYVVNFYINFSKNRLLIGKRESEDFRSAQ